MSASLARLMQWYESQCDGEWEHDWGVKVQTLDNPGWLVQVNLVGTPLQDTPFDPIRVERTKTDWVHCDVRIVGRISRDAPSPTFHGAGGSGNLDEILRIFCDWAEKASA